MTETSKKKQIILAVLLTAANISAFAQGNGMAGITEATNLVTSYFDPATKVTRLVASVMPAMPLPCAKAEMFAEIGRAHV